MTATCTLIDGFKCYAPEVALGTSADYPPEHHDRLFDLEEAHFWFRARNRIVQGLVRRYLGNRPARFLELGVGTGYMLAGLSRFSNLELVGAELYVNALKYARQRLPRVEFIQLDAVRMPFENEFDAVGAFDTLEHIEEDARVIRNVGRALKPGGRFFITVPQHPWLWSTQDDAAFHKRRYTRRGLCEKLRNAGFEIDYTGSFICALFPLLVASRRRMKPQASQEPAEYNWKELQLHPWINAVSGALTRLDEWMIRLGLRVPFGGTLVAVARKPEGA